jgi:hypothetical protein
MKPNLLRQFACYKTVFFIFFTLIFSVKIFAQAPLNDNCSGAVLLTSSTTCNPVTGSLLRSTLSGTAAPTITYTTTSSFATLGAINTLKAECWGAGGAGGGANASNDKGGGGGGGGYSTGNVSQVDAGGKYIVGVGTGGSGSTGAGVNGGLSRLVNPMGTILLSANGGTGGAAGTGTGGLGGAGSVAGTGTGITGAIYRTGGAGAAGGIGSGGFAGGGGGAAGIITNGGSNAGSTVGGASGGTGSGAGGNGVLSTTANGSNGATYGGGGGGAMWKIGGASSRTGGAGANGAVRLTFGNSSSLDVWYRFKALTTNPKIQLSNIGNDLLSKSPYIQLYSGSCGSLTQIAFDASGVLSTGSLTINTFYYIRIATIVTFVTPTTGTYNFDICIVDDNFANLPVDFSKSYINITKGTTGGSVNPGDVLEIRSTFAVQSGTISKISFKDTLKANAGLRFKDSIATRTNEGKKYQFFTEIGGDDAGWRSFPAPGADTTIQINIGVGATSAVTGGGTLTPSSNPSFFQFRCIILATYRVTVTAAYNTKINFGGGEISYEIAGTPYSIKFPRDSLIVYPNLSACSDAVAPANLIGSANNGSFGGLVTGSSASGTQNKGADATINTTYFYNAFNAGSPGDYYYSIANNTAATNTTDQTVNKNGDVSRVFGVWDVSGDHTNATNTAKGNKPCDPALPVSATNPCGYMLVVNSSYRTDKVFEYNASGICSDTYYEVSAWFKNLCYKCGCDSLGRSSTTAGYIPSVPPPFPGLSTTPGGDSAGVRPNIAMQIDGIDYYTTGEIPYQGLGGTQSGSDTLNNWVRRSFVFKTSSTQNSFKVTFRNNAPGGGGNDWAIDDIGLRTCYPSMTYYPPNPLVIIGNPLTITDTVRSYFNSYFYYKWQRKPVSGAWTDIVPGFVGTATPVYNASVNQFEYGVSYTIPGSATLLANSGDLYRVVVASSALNLGNGCNYSPDVSFNLLLPDAVCAFSDTNYAIAPQTGNINWNKLNWSLGHVPTCCESAYIKYIGKNASTDAVTIDITNDICIINLTLENTSTTSNQLFKTILHPGFNMQMNGNVRMGTSSITATTDSCIFIARGGGSIKVKGNTVIGYPTDSAYCIFGTSADVASEATYILKGDSLTFNKKSFTTDKLMTVIMEPYVDTAYFVNNTAKSFFPNAVTFESFKIGDGVKASTVIAAGNNPDAFLNNRAGTLKVTSYSKLVLPANYSINSLGATNSFDLNYKASLELGGSSGGIIGSNFPSNYNTYYVDSTSTVLFYGNAQTLPGASEKIINYGNINISGSGVKKASSSNINILGDFCRLAGTHTFDANAGRVTFSSAIKGQKYYAAVGTTPMNFYDLTNNNTHAGGLTIDSSIAILNELELKASTKIILNNGNVTMRSSASRTSHITDLGTVSIPTIVYNGSNRFVVERYLFAKKAWRLLATPLQQVGVDATASTIAASWRENNAAHSSTGYGVQLTGPTGPSIASPLGELDLYTQRGSMKYYDDVNNNFIEIANTSTTKINNAKGYFVFVRGDRGAANTVTGAGTETNLRIKGKINIGNQVFNVLPNKYQSVGNPFASQVDFKKVDKTNIAAAFTIWNPNNVGLYNVGGYENYVLNGGDYWLNGIVGGTMRNNVESGEAFFVQSNSASVGNVTFKEADKASNFNTVSRVGNASNASITMPTLDVQLYTKLAADSFTLVDGLSVNFDQNYSNGIDNNDVRKFANPFDNISIKSNSELLVVERKAMPTAADSIQLNIAGTRVGEYKLHIDPSILTTAGVDMFVKDKFLQTTTAIDANELLQLPFSITNDIASKAVDRFVIIFKQSANTNFTTIAATRNTDKTVTVNWGVANEKNVQNYLVEQSVDGINFTNLSSQIALVNNGTNPTYTKLDAAANKENNWYRIKLINTNGSFKYSSIAMVAAVKEEIINTVASIAIEPNIISNGIVNLKLKNKQKGNYTVEIYNSLGQKIKTQNIFIQSNNELFEYYQYCKR